MVQGVLIVEDHAIVRSALRAELDLLPDKFRFLDAVGSKEEAFTRMAEVNPQLIVVDHFLKTTTGLELLSVLKDRRTSLKMLVFTQCKDPIILKSYWSFPVDAIVDKAADVSELREALLAVASGDRYLSPCFRELLSGGGGESLTRRELEVVRMVAQGYSNKEIAEYLGCSDHTIKSHKTNIMQKLQVNTSVEVATWAQKNGLQ